MKRSSLLSVLLPRMRVARGGVLASALCASACGYLGILSEDGASNGVVLGGASSVGPDLEPSGDGGSSGGKKDGSSSGGRGDGDSGGAAMASGATGGGAGHSGGAASQDSSGGSDMGGGTSGSGGVSTSAGGDGSSSGGAPGTGGEDGGSGGADLGSGGWPGTGGASSSGGSSSGSGGAGSAVCAVADAACELLVGALVHRYSFEGTGVDVIDSVGQKHGLARGTALDGSGSLAFHGLNSYVDLPAGLISSLANATFEVWFVWHGGEPWQKLFEFGDHDVFLDPVDYLYVTPEGGGSIEEQRSLAAGLRHLTLGDRQLRTVEMTETHALTHVVLIVDDVENRLTFFKNGEWVAQRDDTDIRLDELRDEVNRLGRSLFPDDPYFDGEMTEFRIYDQVLTPDSIAKSYLMGPDVVFSLE